MPVIIGFKCFFPHRGLLRLIKTHLRNPVRFIHATVKGNSIHTRYLIEVNCLLKEVIEQAECQYSDWPMTV